MRRKTAPIEVGQIYGRLTVIKKASRGRWECTCVCGKHITPKASRLFQGFNKSCGCLKTTNANKNFRKQCYSRPRGQAGFNRLFSAYKKQAFDRNRPFVLTKDFFAAITKLPCHYCGSPPSNTCRPMAQTEEMREYKTYTYNGVDRKDNSIGYEESNCLPCC